MIHSIQQFIAVVFILLGVTYQVIAQPIGSPIDLNSDTPAYADAGLQPINGPEPSLLARTGAEDREPKIAILNNGSIVVFWVNLNGSHHLNGLDSQGALLAPVVEHENAVDVLVGVNTGVGTNWTLCKSDPSSGNILAAATFFADSLNGAEAQLPDSVVDADGVVQDNSQGHGFFRLFNESLEPITDPISVSQFSAGHREWDACWLNDGKFVIGVVNRDHRYADDPDWPEGGAHTASLNIFNPDGSRFMDEFFIDDLTGEQRNLWLGALAHGFVCVYQDDDSLVGGSNLYKGVMFDNNGVNVKEFIVTDEENAIHPSWMAAGGGGRFVTVHALSAPETIGLPVLLNGMPVVLAQLWSDQGERIGPYILVSQHDDFRNVSRPRCAMARNGSFICSWIDDGADIIQFTDSVIARIFNADGTPSTGAFVAHPIPEFEETLGGDPSESMPAIANDRAAVAWATRAAPNGQFRDIALMAYNNPATPVEL
ncbi:MAG: hypothetical protein ACP5I1_17790, partial [Candidatus Hinthialibacter sp.]